LTKAVFLDALGALAQGIADYKDVFIIEEEKGLG
jgi:hypothetical protein